MCMGQVFISKTQEAIVNMMEDTMEQIIPNCMYVYMYIRVIKLHGIWAHSSHAGSVTCSHICTLHY